MTRWNCFQPPAPDTIQADLSTAQPDGSAIKWMALCFLCFFRAFTATDADSAGLPRPALNITIIVVVVLPRHIPYWDNRAMKTISLKMPARLHAKLQRAAKKRSETQSELVRAALAQFLNGQQAAGPPVSALQLAGDLVGCAEGPGDLSTNPKYMEGFGK